VIHLDGKVAKINPYCKFKIGMYNAKTKAALHEAENPHWNERITVFRSLKKNIAD